MPGPSEVRLDDAFVQVVNEVAARCQAQRAAGGLLAELKGIVTGDRARVRPDPPYLWVAVAAGEVDQARAKHETWTLPLMLSVFVHSEAPHEGWLDAFRLAARARSVALAGRRQAPPLGLSFVEDLQSAGMAALGRFESGRRFGAFARVDARVALVEPPLPEIENGDGNG